MIKVGIYGPDDVDSPLRKQLLRLLLRHPDVDLHRVSSATGTGVPLARLHPVYTGDTELALERGLDTEDLDVLFVIDEENFTQEIVDAVKEKDLAVIVLGEANNLRLNLPEGMVYGFAEYNRKALVRGARMAVSPSPVALLIETALFPLAKNWMLQGDIQAEVRAPYHPEGEVDEALKVLGEIQKDLNADISLRNSGHVPYERMDLTLRLPLSHTVSEIRNIYEQAYEDHSFVHVVDGNEGIDEDLRGSNKCLMQIFRQGDSLVINASADLQTRSRAGNAVHLMNLIFGLYERTGLSI